MANTKITFLGHSTFLIQTPENKTILIDPFLKENPVCPDGYKGADKLDKVDIVLVTHGHFDHLLEAVDVGKRFSPQTVAVFEIAGWLEKKGLQNVQPMGKGGTLKIPGAEKIRVTLCHAIHSSGIQDGDDLLYGGEACSLFIELEDGTRLFHAGDTALFGDMKLIGELYKPELAMVPIGDRFTMGPNEAAIACKYLGVKKAIPMHYGTFPILTGTPEAFADALHGTGIEMIPLQPGESY